MIGGVNLDDMSLHKKYSKEFKEALVAKVLSRGNKTIEEVCSPLGISKVTASNWVRRCGIKPNMNKSNTATKWSAERKFSALLESSQMDEESLGAFLRREGLHSHTLTEWRAEVVGALEAKRKSPKKDERDVRIHELEKNLRRKDKALAEASALLILKKKVDLIWGQSEEEK
jgi:transposase-like protein